MKLKINNNRFVVKLKDFEFLRLNEVSWNYSSLINFYSYDVFPRDMQIFFTLENYNEVLTVYLLLESPDKMIVNIWLMW